MRHAAPQPPRDPLSTHAYLVGGGIASLAAATHLIHDAKVPAGNIHILEAMPVAGGAMDGTGDPDHGYVLRGGRMLNFSYLCLYELLSTIPSLNDPKVTVMDEINSFNATATNKTDAHARLVAHEAKIINAKSLGLNVKDRLSLVQMTLVSESSLGASKISDHFSDHFFTTNFWFMWCSMFAFNPWHSAVEFRRYLHRFVHEFPRINTLAGVDRTPLNQFDSIIRPIIAHLQVAGVDFQYNTNVVDLLFGAGEAVTQIAFERDGARSFIEVKPSDIVTVTIGSMTAASSVGDTALAPAITELERAGGPWTLWETLAEGRPLFGNPKNFLGRVEESNWESFTVTLRDPTFFNLLTEWSHNQPGTGALVTFKDSQWLLSIVVPHQPHFLGQPSDVQVFWGYALFTDKPGDFVKKPMSECTGAEIFTELLGHLKFPATLLPGAIIRPAMLPYITSQFLTRSKGDRPPVLSADRPNLAFLGQYVEIPEDTVFTVEYSVRAAQMAVYGLMGLDKKPPAIYKGERDLHVLAGALKALLS